MRTRELNDDQVRHVVEDELKALSGDVFAMWLIAKAFEYANGNDTKWRVLRWAVERFLGPEYRITKA